MSEKENLTDQSQSIPIATLGCLDTVAGEHHLRITARTDQGKLVYIDQTNPVLMREGEPVLVIRHEPDKQVALCNLTELYRIWGDSILSVWVWSNMAKRQPSLMQVALGPEEADVFDPDLFTGFNGKLGLRTLDHNDEFTDRIMRHPCPEMNAAAATQLTMMRLDEKGVSTIYDGWHDRPVPAPGRALHSVRIQGPDEAPYPVFDPKRIQPGAKEQSDALQQGYFPG